MKFQGEILEKYILHIFDSYGCIIVVVQSLSLVWFFANSWAAACQASLSFTLSWSLFKLMSIKSVMPFNHLCHPLFLLSSVFPSWGLFQWVGSSHQMYQYQSLSGYSGLISFRIDWFDFLAVQGTLKSLLQHHSSKAPILWCPAFFMVQLSHPYMTTGRAIALTVRTFVGKVVSLLFNALS